MPKYQIVYNHGGRSHSYQYFDADKDIEKAASEKANQILERDRENSSFRSFGFFKPQRTLVVREMDMIKKEPKRGGHKFKLQLRFIQFTFGSGRKERNEWYEPKE